MRIPGGSASCNHPIRDDAILKGCSHSSLWLSDDSTVSLWKLEFLQGSVMGGGRDWGPGDSWRGELVSQTEASCGSDSLSDHLAGESGTEALTR